MEYKMITTKLPNGGEFQEDSDGNKYWSLNNQLHREDGPAIEHDGNKRWYINDKLIPCTTQKEFERLMRLRAFW
jgi:hypothetical protein